jgi:hypothetical protein
MTKKLSQKESEMLFNYEKKFGKEKADQWRQKLLDATEEIVEVEETEINSELEDLKQKIDSLGGEGEYVKIPDGVNAENFIQIWDTLCEIVTDIFYQKVDRGLVVLIKREGNMIQIQYDGGIVAYPEMTDAEEKLYREIYDMMLERYGNDFEKVKAKAEEAFKKMQESEK